MNSRQRLVEVLLWPALFLSGGVVLSQWNYKVFHLLAEGGSAAIAVSVFVVTWVSRRYLPSGFFVAIGIGYAHVAALDFTHAISYKDIGLLDRGSANIATQLWMAARFVEVTSLLTAFLFVARPAPFDRLRAYHLAAFAAILVAVFSLRIFPDCFLDDSGLTRFKIVGEYAVIVGLLAVILATVRRRSAFDAAFVGLFLAFLLVRATSELMFTTYGSVFDHANMAGHLLKMAADWLLYLAVAKRTIETPHQLLEKAGEAALSANVAKSKFLAAIGHDLHQPLKAAGLFLEHAVEVPDAKRLPLIENARSALQMANDMLDSIVHFVLVDRGQIEPHPRAIAMAEILAPVTASHTEAALRRQVELTSVHTAAVVVADPVLLRRCVGNLIGNAVKHARGRVLIGCRKEGRGRLRVEVWDDGRGITPEKFRLIFDEFHKEGPQDGLVSAGLGLGLAVVDQIAAKMGWEVAVRSQPGQGSCFSISVPVAAPS